MYTHLDGSVGPLSRVCLAFITVSKGGISELSALVRGCSLDEELHRKHPCHSHQRPSLPRDAIIHTHSLLMPGLFTASHHLFSHISATFPNKTDLNLYPSG